MFWKRKALGSVTIFDGDDVRAANRFDDLGIEEFKSKDLLSHLSADQIRRLALQAAQAGKDSTSRALKSVLESREIGIATADTLQKQTRQLENAERECEDVLEYLEKSERKSKTTVLL